MLVPDTGGCHTELLHDGQDIFLIAPYTGLKERLVHDALLLVLVMAFTLLGKHYGLNMKLDFTNHSIHLHKHTHVTIPLTGLLESICDFKKAEVRSSVLKVLSNEGNESTVQVVHRLIHNRCTHDVCEAGRVIAVLRQYLRTCSGSTFEVWTYGIALGHGSHFPHFEDQLRIGDVGPCVECIQAKNLKAYVLPEAANTSGTPQGSHRVICLFKVSFSNFLTTHAFKGLIVGVCHLCLYCVEVFLVYHVLPSPHRPCQSRDLHGKLLFPGILRDELIDAHLSIREVLAVCLAEVKNSNSSTSLVSGHPCSAYFYKPPCIGNGNLPQALDSSRPRAR
mmetsp:Transcript_44271/g.102258  ORF Transcript_44271/g.102258 Transcript_44271/m.102258 type:complete len:335 (+) Transcript_44271:1553-2557(+)